MFKTICRVSKIKTFLQVLSQKSDAHTAPNSWILHNINSSYVACLSVFTYFIYFSPETSPAVRNLTFIQNISSSANNEENVERTFLSAVDDEVLSKDDKEHEDDTKEEEDQQEEEEEEEEENGENKEKVFCILNATVPSLRWYLYSVFMF